MKIVKNNLIIRSAEESDAEILTMWWNDGKVMAHAGFPNGLKTTVEKTLNQIQANKVKLSQLCIIEVNNKPIGEMNFRIDNGFAEIGIKICVLDYQGKGYGAILLKMLIEFLFCDSQINSKTKIDKIILDTNLKNIHAQYVYEKIGFKRLRENQNAWQDQLGNWQSSVDYELTKEDWKKS